jgi:VWFA-related protein
MPGIGTLLYDSVYLAANEMLHGQAGRKALILISDGVDMGSKMTRDEAVEAAHRSDAIIYSIRYFDSGRFKGGSGRRGRRAGRPDFDSDGEKALKKMSEETGGRLFEVRKKMTLEQIFEQIQEELRNQYSLGYTPAEAGDGGFRRIKLTTTNQKLKVQARAGYYPDGGV